MEVCAGKLRPKEWNAASSGVFVILSQPVKTSINSLH
jgi:hypothetical protein